MGRAGILSPDDRVELLEGWLVEKMTKARETCPSFSTMSKSVAFRAPSARHGGFPSIARAVLALGSVNASTYLERIARALRTARLGAILVGNAAAAIQGAPVSTLDFDFLIRDTPRSAAKIRAFARALSASAVVPYEGVSRMVRVTSGEIQVDLLPRLYGVRSSFEKLAISVDLGSCRFRDSPRRQSRGHPQEQAGRRSPEGSRRATDSGGHAP
jgi:hypothetical protein